MYTHIVAAPSRITPGARSFADSAGTIDRWRHFELSVRWSSWSLICAPHPPTLPPLYTLSTPPPFSLLALDSTVCSDQSFCFRLFSLFLIYSLSTSQTNVIYPPGCPLPLLYSHLLALLYPIGSYSTHTYSIFTPPPPLYQPSFLPLYPLQSTTGLPSPPPPPLYPHLFPNLPTKPRYTLTSPLPPQSTLSSTTPTPAPPPTDTTLTNPPSTHVRPLMY